MNEVTKNAKITIDYKVLNYLRENTTLGPLDLLKIKREEVIANGNKKYYMNQNSNDLVESDYSVAEQLEYDLRLKAFERSVEKLWLEYGDGLDLSEFAFNIINQNANAYSSKRK